VAHADTGFPGCSCSEHLDIDKAHEGQDGTEQCADRARQHIRQVPLQYLFFCTSAYEALVSMYDGFESSLAIRTGVFVMCRESLFENGFGQQPVDM